MTLLTSSNTLRLWQDMIKNAENRCSVVLKKDLESYLISLLIRYLDKPEILQQALALTFLEGQQQSSAKRSHSLQMVGDQCLLYVGLFPQNLQKKLLKISYFVQLGKTAYASISTANNDLYSSLAMEFVVLMDVLQSIRHNPDLTPLEAYEQWNLVGSQRALKLLKQFTNNIPLKT